MSYQAEERINMVTMRCNTWAIAATTSLILLTSMVFVTSSGTCSDFCQNSCDRLQRMYALLQCPAALHERLCTLFKLQMEAKKCTSECGIECTKPFEEETRSGGWLVIQRRCNGCVLFNRTMAEYKVGFGNPKEEFWLGLDQINLLTSTQAYELRVDLELFGGTFGYVVYSHFSVGPSSDNYRLGSGDMTSGNISESLSVNGQAQFSAPGSGTLCSTALDSGWWWTLGAPCAHSNLNGQYQPSGVCTDIYRCPLWLENDELWVLKTTEMKIRPMRIP